MIKRLGLILSSPFLFIWMAVSMLLTLPIWLFTGKEIFQDCIDLLEKKKFL